MALRPRTPHVYLWSSVLCTDRLTSSDFCFTRFRFEKKIPPMAPCFTFAHGAAECVSYAREIPCALCPAPSSRRCALRPRFCRILQRWGRVCPHDASLSGRERGVF